MISTWLSQIRIGVERQRLGLRPRVKRDARAARSLARNKRLQLRAQGSDVERAAADFGRAADLAVGFDEMHDAVGAAGERLDRGARVGDRRIVAVIGLGASARPRYGRAR